MKKINLRYFILPVLAFCTALALNAQNRREPDEFHVHFNKTFYASGETAWFTIYFLNRDVESAVVHAGLFDHTGNLLIDRKLPVMGNIASGSIDIPIEWQDGWYGFRVVTRWNLNFGSGAYYEKLLAVYNSSAPEPGTFRDPGRWTINPDTISSEVNTTGLEISFDKKDYRPGDTIILSIQAVDEDLSCRLSLSVLDLTQYAVISGISAGNIKPVTTQSRLLSTGYSPAFNTEKHPVLEGVIMKLDSPDLISSNVISIYLARSRDFVRTRAVRGKFSVELPGFQGEGIIQVLNLNPFQDQEPLIREVKIWEHLDGENQHLQPPAHTREIDAYLYNLRLRMKLNEIFADKKESAMIKEAVIRPLPPSDKHYDMTGFKDLKDLEEFVKVIMLTANYALEGDHTSIRLQNEQKQYYFMRHPWYFSDGLLSYQEGEFLSTPFTSITTIDLYTTSETLTRWDPLMIQSGIVALTTPNRYWENKFLAKKNVIRYEGFSTGPEFVNSQPELQAGLEPGPDLRPVVYWAPSVAFRQGEKTIVKFVTTDNPGIFRIEVEGISSDGEIIRGMAFYKTRVR
ncbi:MAG TPA: hypothetical protein VI583_11400 [Cyclobacteriaceae bacterium]|nr:hypothetical protein [Cyclobacteriaceae bacterium]